MKIAVIGAGVSGLSVSHCLKEHFHVEVFEADTRPGGLIKCDKVKGCLYHKVGGHVFNSRRQDVLDWFWNFFDRQKEFILTTRNAIIALPNQQLIGYPIENHIYMLDIPVIRKIIDDLLFITKQDYPTAENFETFLRTHFGDTLFDIYFQPYNEKIWKTALTEVPLSWLEGKLPMPTIEDIMYNNFNREKDNKMVHSSFYYAKNNGSQFLADRLAEGLNISYSTKISTIKHVGIFWEINGEKFDKVVFCGNIKDLPEIMLNTCIDEYKCFIEKLAYHGTTTVLCEMEQNPYSWIYLPDKMYSAHRIICTGNFSPYNNCHEQMTATVEFTDELSKQDIDSQLNKMPFSLKYIIHHYTPCTYPIQSADTRTTIRALKDELEKENFYLSGRFAEWEYYNMDAAMGAAIDLSKRIIK